MPASCVKVIQVSQAQRPAIRKFKMVLATKNITLNFGGVTAIKDLSFALSLNEILSIIGPNGAGKTSVYNTITGLYEPTSGEILFNNKSLRTHLEVKDLLKLFATTVLITIIIHVVANLQSLWSVAITANYIYQQPFDWIKAFGDGISFLINADFTTTIIAFFLVGLIMFYLKKRDGFTTYKISNKGISRTFQNIRLFPELTVIENLLVPKFCEDVKSVVLNALNLNKLKKLRESQRQKALSILERINITKFADTKVSALSYGDQRRVEIARALITDPKIILLDEPAAGMNPTESNELMVLIKSLKSEGVGVILIEHHMKLVMEISDRIIVLDRGELIAEGNPEEVRQNERVISAYLG